MKFVGPSWVSATPQELAWGHWVLSKWPSGHNPPSTLSYSSVLWWKDQSMLVRIAFFVSLHLQSWMSATPQAASLGPINKLRVLGVVCSVSCVQYPVFSIQYSVFSVRYSVFGVQCSVFSVQCSVFSVQCSVFSVHQFKGNNISVRHCGRWRGFWPIMSLHLFSQTDQSLASSVGWVTLCF